MSTKTLVVLLVDETGSMMYERDKTIDGVNRYIDSLRREASGKVRLSLTTWNSYAIKKLRSEEKLATVPSLRFDEYVPNGLTPLYDVICTEIENTKSFLKTKNGWRVIFVIVTDGYENHSTRYTLLNVKGMIAHCREMGWKFVFMGADIDALSMANDLGIRAADSLSFSITDVTSVLESAAKSTSRYINGELSDFWQDTTNTVNTE